MGVYTNFPDGVTSFGIPLVSSGTLPWAGGTYFVNETTGSDGQTGAANAPLKTLARALVLAAAAPQAGNVDQVIFFTGTIHTTTTITWATNRVHLIGLDAPSNNGRSRISASGSSVFTPLVNVTAQGCLFANFGTFHGFNDASTQICWTDSGGRNSYSNVQFLGMGNTTAAAQAGSRSLLVTGGNGENTFNNCTIGLDTVVRGTAVNASLELAGGSPRNVFRGCVFQADVSLATEVHVTVGVGGIDRYALFDNCAFVNAVESGSTTMNAAITANASAGGAVILQNPISLGATAIATTGPVYIVGAVPTATTSGIAIKAT